MSVALVLFIGGCSSSMAPDCNDNKTKAEVLKKIWANIRNRANQTTDFRDADLKGNSGEYTDGTGTTWKYKYSDGVFKYYREGTEQDYTIENIRTASVNKDTGKFECAADIKYEERNNGVLDPRTLLASVTYTSELADKGKKHLVAFNVEEIKIQPNTTQIKDERAALAILKAATVKASDDMINYLKTQTPTNAVITFLKDSKYSSQKSPCPTVNGPLYRNEPPGKGFISLQVVDNNFAIKLEACTCDDGHSFIMRKVFKD